MNNSESVFGHKLSARTYYTLWNHGKRTKEQVLESYIKGDLLKLRNFGKASHNEVFDWLDKDIKSNLKPLRFDNPRPKKVIPLTPETMPEKTYKAIGHMNRKLLDLTDEMRQMSYTLERWTHANHALHRILTVVGTERKYTAPTNIQ